jgi:hypothetical protein
MSTERPTIKDIYDAVSALEQKIEKGFARKNEVKLWIALGLLGGQTAASLIAAYITHLSPPEQAAALFNLIF